MVSTDYSAKISIIVPVYNVEPYLRRCLKSLLNQTHENLEIILVNDGSTDNCGRICDDFAEEDSRIIVIHKENGGVCSARNAAMEIMTGDYIGFVDPDDWVEADMYEYLLKNLTLYDADISCCNYIKVTRRGRHVIANEKIREPEFYDAHSTIENVVSKWTIRTIFPNKLFKYELLKDFKFPEDVTYEFTRVSHKIFANIEKLVYLPGAKYYYRNTPNSIVNTFTIDNQANCVLAHISRFDDLIDSYPHLKAKMMEHIVRESLTLVRSCYANKLNIKENTDKLNIISKFVAKHFKCISNMGITNGITIRKLEYLTTFSSKHLNRAELLYKCGVGYSKLVKVKSILTKKKNRMINNLRVFFRVNQSTVSEPLNIRFNDYSTNDKVKMNKLHNVHLELMDEFVRICDKHKLKYYLYGGTLLGAMRHKGFIPWDDDVDIIMHRDDYEKFGEICKTELDTKKYFYQTCFTDEWYTRNFAKIRKNNTAVREPVWDDYKLHKGIYIDILPLDYFPPGKWRRRRLEKRFSWLNAVCLSDYTASLNIFKRLLFRIYKRFPRKFSYKRREKFLSNLYKYKDSKLVCSFGSHYKPFQRRIMKKAWFRGDQYMDFEGRKYRIPDGWKEYFLQVYGESYMELPPDDERQTHFNLYEVEFDTTER